MFPHRRSFGKPRTRFSRRPHERVEEAEPRGEYTSIPSGMNGSESRVSRNENAQWYGSGTRQRKDVDPRPPWAEPPLHTEPEHSGNFMRMDGRALENIFDIAGSVAPIVTEFPTALGLIAFNAWRKWPTDTKLSKALLSLEYEVPGGIPERLAHSTSAYLLHQNPAEWNRRSSLTGPDAEPTNQLSEERPKVSPSKYNSMRTGADYDHTP